MVSPPLGKQNTELVHITNQARYEIPQKSLDWLTRGNFKQR